MNVLIGSNIKRIRKEAGISQQMLADILGLHQTAVCRIERGEQSLTATQLYILSKKLKLELGYFFQ